MIASIFFMSLVSSSRMGLCARRDFIEAREESQPMATLALLTAEETRRAEKAAIASGVAAAALMESAGSAAAAALIELVKSPRPTIVLCGPGANGGDGFVVARRLKEAGFPVAVAAMGEAGLSGDAKLMASLFDGERKEFSPSALDGAALIVDAIFGVGLSRPIEGAARALIEAANASPAPVVAIDIPSGVDADTGAVRGAAIAALATFTFTTKKPGHVLFPGRGYCGATRVLPIGVEDRHFSAAQPRAFENHPALWLSRWRRPGALTHKYERGAVAVLSGARGRTGAARLAAMAALRAGAGAVTVLSPPDAIDENAAHLTAIMLREISDAADVARQVEEARARAVVIGPGCGVGQATIDSMRTILSGPARAVIDADAISSFASDPKALFAMLRKDDVLTPHEGEFARLFPDLGIDYQGGRLARARAAAARAGATALLKGADTVIAAPDGRAVVNVNAPGDLATAGSGDVLAGFAAAFLAAGLDGLDAAASAAWLHGACGQAAGPGLVAEDLPTAVPSVLRALYAPPQADGART
jgi:NAD(P)H-hydrate epimerase